MSSRASVFMCAAEVSGDARGARLARELQRLVPGLGLFGVGGPRMQQAGVAVGVDLTDTSTIGWVDHWGSAYRYVQALRWARQQVRRRRPLALILIDAPGIGFPTARFARAAGIPVAYYITPQTWLWAPAAAVNRLRKHADVVVPVLEAEANLYRTAGLHVIYHGHPMVDDVPIALPSVRPQADGNEDESAEWLAIVPGSRRHSIRRLLPAMLDAAALIRERGGPSRVCVAVAAPSLRAEIDRVLDGPRPFMPALESDLGAILRRSRLTVAASGSNLLEAVMADVPAVACYRLDPVSYAIADHVMGLKARMPAFTMPNILAKQPLIPELIQNDVTPERIAQHAMRLLTDEHVRQSVLNGYSAIRATLGRPGATRRIARELVERLRLA